MKHLQLSPAWFFSGPDGQQLDPRLFALLRAIHQEGKLTEAATRCDLSYRHAWNLLGHWGQFFGAPLVDKHKGRGTKLSPLGEKLLWAEKRVAARLEPQLESLGSEISLEIASLLDGQKPILRMHASHGYAVALLPKFMADRQFDLQYSSPTDALAALARGACDLAGFHIPVDFELEVLREYRRRLPARSYSIIQFISRCQGLMLRPGNPRGVNGIADLAQPDLRFINRQSNSGTRALFDVLLAGSGIAPSQVAGYEQEEFTHSAVAAYVAAGMADAGFGVEAAARQFGLAFQPLAQERYVFACHRQRLNDSAIADFIALIASDEFTHAVSTLPGYSAQDAGTIRSVKELLA